ncbi:MAG: hypothetical protein ACRDIC_19560 [bacterium]
MKLLPWQRLGAREVEPNVVAFGLVLPWVSAGHGFRISVKVIHGRDQFLQDIPPEEFELEPAPAGPPRARLDRRPVRPRVARGQAPGHHARLRAACVERHRVDLEVPAVSDLMIYELMLSEFAGGVDGTISRPDYLADLGVNCLELMPGSRTSPRWSTGASCPTATSASTSASGVAAT